MRHLGVEKFVLILKIMSGEQLSISSSRFCADLIGLLSVGSLQMNHVGSAVHTGIERDLRDFRHYSVS